MSKNSEVIVLQYTKNKFNQEKQIILKILRGKSISFEERIVETPQNIFLLIIMISSDEDKKKFIEDYNKFLSEVNFDIYLYSNVDDPYFLNDITKKIKKYCENGRYSNEDVKKGSEFFVDLDKKVA